jgi:hypothetical protein
MYEPMGESDLYLVDLIIFLRSKLGLLIGIGIGFLEVKSAVSKYPTSLFLTLSGERHNFYIL